MAAESGHPAVAPLQPRLDQITQNTRKLVQPERLAQSEQMIADLFASGIEDRVLHVGAYAPAFSLPDAATGRNVASSDLLALGPLIVSFFRGRWDPYCTTELETWRDLYPHVRSRGATLVAISPQSLRQSQFAVEQHRLPFPLLHDAGAELAYRFGIAYSVTPAMQRYFRSILINLPFIHGGKNVMAAPDDGAWHLPLPATFVIGRDGVLRFAEAHADFRVRPEPAEVLAAL